MWCIFVLWYFSLGVVILSDGNDQTLTLDTNPSSDYAAPVGEDAFSGVYSPNLYAKKSKEDYSAAWLITRDRFFGCQSRINDSQNMEGVVFAVTRPRLPQFRTLLTRDYFDFMVEHLSSTINKIPFANRKIFQVYNQKMQNTVHELRREATTSTSISDRRVVADRRLFQTIAVLIYSSISFSRPKINPGFQASIRKHFFEATFWSVHRYLPHIIVFVASDKDRGTVEQMQLPLLFIKQLQVPLDYRNRTISLPKYALGWVDQQWRRAHYKKIEIQQRGRSPTYSESKLAGDGPSKEAEEEEEEEDGLDAATILWNKFRYIYYTEGDQILHMRQATSIFDSLDVGRGNYAMVPHRMQTYALPLLQFAGQRELIKVFSRRQSLAHLLFVPYPAAAPLITLNPHDIGAAPLVHTTTTSSSFSFSSAASTATTTTTTTTIAITNQTTTTTTTTTDATTAAATTSSNMFYKLIDTPPPNAVPAIAQDVLADGRRSAQLRRQQMLPELQVGGSTGSKSSRRQSGAGIPVGSCCEAGRYIFPERCVSNYNNKNNNKNREAAIGTRDYKGIGRQLTSTSPYKTKTKTNIMERGAAVPNSRWYECPEYGLRNVTPWLQFGPSGFTFSAASVHKGKCTYSSRRQQCPLPPHCDESQQPNPSSTGIGRSSSVGAGAGSPGADSAVVEDGRGLLLSHQHLHPQQQQQQQQQSKQPQPQQLQRRGQRMPYDSHKGGMCMESTAFTYLGPAEGKQAALEAHQRAIRKMMNLDLPLPA